MNFLDATQKQRNLILKHAYLFGTLLEYQKEKRGLDKFLLNNDFYNQSKLIPILDSLLDYPKHRYQENLFKLEPEDERKFIEYFYMYSLPKMVNAAPTIKFLNAPIARQIKILLYQSNITVEREENLLILSSKERKKLMQMFA